MTEQEFLSTLAGMDNPAMSAFGEAMVGQIAAIKAKVAELEKKLAHWKGWAENEREENQDWAKRLRSRAEAAESELATVKRERDSAAGMCDAAMASLAESREEVRGLDERVGRMVKAFERMQEFHDCMEAQRKDEPLPEGHDEEGEACGDGVCYRVGDIIKAGIAASKEPAKAAKDEPK